MLVVAVIAALLGAFVMSLVGRHTAVPRTVEGWAQPNAHGTAIALFASPEDLWSDGGYVITGARWQDDQGSWHDGADSPTCVGTDTAAFTPVRLGVVRAQMPDWRHDHVIWLECLGPAQRPQRR